MDQKRSDVLQKPMSNFSRSRQRRTHRPRALLGGAGCAAPEAVKGNSYGEETLRNRFTGINVRLCRFVDRQES